MTEKHLKKLGFKKVKVGKKEAGGYAPFYYYTWDVAKTIDSFSLITCANDETVNGDWWVEIFNDSSCRFYDKKDVKKLIHLVTKGHHTKLLEESIDKLTAPCL